MVIDSIRGKETVLSVESLKAPPTHAAMLQDAADLCRIAAAMEMPTTAVWY